MVRFSISVFLLLSFLYVFAQDWNLERDRNGIKVYSAQQENSNVHRYMATTLVDNSIMETYRQVVNFEDNRDFLERINKLEKLNYYEDSLYNNYMVFDLPWPFSDRDVVVSMSVTLHPSRIVLESGSASELVPVYDDIIRIIDYQETWILESIPGGGTAITVQGHADPSGSIPAWVSNLFIANEPYNFLSGLKEKLNNQRE